MRKVKTASREGAKTRRKSRAEPVVYGPLVKGGCCIAGETIFLEVAAQTRACSHPLNPTKPCLQIREIYYDKSGIKTGNSGDFENLYQPIEGYTHTPGIRNVLRVKRFKVQNPAADASSIAYVLDLVVESEVVKP
ncbi:DUF4377 domain-containing protein [Desulfococcaceae bacterium OttesenSCG-928-F15]|nr:DUF4377 domain-containing protein [Desulfococcaceae bacterium OttesenSCG-928-F15]